MTDITPVPFKKKNLVGAWEYVDAYTLLPSGATTRNFGTAPKGLFVIRDDGIYEHIVMSDNLPQVASGQLKVMTASESAFIATNILAHFGTYTVDEHGGTFTANIEWSTFPNFNGIHQQRIITKLTDTELEYANLQTTNGGDAKIIAKLRRRSEDTHCGHHDD